MACCPTTRSLFDCYRVERPVCGRQLHPPKSSAFYGALFRPFKRRDIIHRMKWTFLFLALALYANAQSSADKPSESGDSTTAKKVDPKLHADAIRLVEAVGAKQRIQGSFKQMVDDGAKQMMEKCTRCNPEFADEWKMRFIARSNFQDYLDVYVRVYEKYFTDAEINELISLQKSDGTSKTASPSPALKEKLTSVMPSAMGDSVGGCAQIGAKLGAEIGSEIEREHPEYLKPEADKNGP
jgi:hypothetical protein